MKVSVLFVLYLLGAALAQQYDYIFCGLGAASSITLSRLLTETTLGQSTKQILVLEHGPPLAYANGGRHFPVWDPTGSKQATVFDIPGEYSNLAWNPQGEPYRQPQIRAEEKKYPWTWQGRGYGGNSQFNGMLYQEPPQAYLDFTIPFWKDKLKAIFTTLRSKFYVSEAPSADRVNYLDGVHHAWAPLYRNVFNNTDSVDSSDLSKTTLANGFWGRPSVVTAGAPGSTGQGRRGGPVSGFLATVIGSDGLPLPKFAANLKVIPWAQVYNLNFNDANNRALATGVQYAINGTTYNVEIKSTGKIIIGCGTLLTTKLLYGSGIGPVGTETDVLEPTPWAPTPPAFQRHNPKVGTQIFDHVGTEIVVHYKGPRSVPNAKAGQPNDYVENMRYNYYPSSQTSLWPRGPYAQYGPVTVGWAKSDNTKKFPNFEFFANPFGPWTDPVNPDLNTDTSFTVLSILMNTTSTGKVRLDNEGNVKKTVGGYYAGQDLTDQVNAIKWLINTFLAKDPNFVVTLGPGSTLTPEFPNKASDTDIRNYILQNSYGYPNWNVPYGKVYPTMMSINHHTGTVPAIPGTTESLGGTDPKNLRVRGTDNVHVVDASVFPNTIPCHPIATIMAMGYLAAELVLVPK